MQTTRPHWPSDNRLRPTACLQARPFEQQTSGGLTSSGLKYDQASVMRLPPGKSAPPPRTAGKSAGLGGLASSGLKYDPASGMWLPPGKTAPTPPPGAASSSRPAAPQRGLSSSGFAYDAQSGMWLPKHKLPG